MSLVSVLVDSREPASITTLAFGGVPKTVTTLDAGDLLGMCADGAVLGIERKTCNDLLNTLRAGRLYPQLARLRETTPWAYLVIVGAWYPTAEDALWVEDGSALGSRETGWKWSAVQGALLDVQEIGVRVVSAAPGEYEETVLRLAKRTRTTLRVPPVRDTALCSEYEAVLTALPGIGPERAATILRSCGTPAWALVALTETPEVPRHRDSVPIPGIGKGLRRAVRDALGLEDWAELAVVNAAADDAEPAPEATTTRGCNNDDRDEDRTHARRAVGDPGG